MAVCRLYHGDCVFMITLKKNLKWKEIHKLQIRIAELLSIKSRRAHCSPTHVMTQHHLSLLFFQEATEALFNHLCDIVDSKILVPDHLLTPTAKEVITDGN